MKTPPESCQMKNARYSTADHKSLQHCSCPPRRHCGKDDTAEESCKGRGRRLVVVAGSLTVTERRIGVPVQLKQCFMYTFLELKWLQSARWRYFAVPNGELGYTSN
ncbi:hypothetical protein NDU88_001598 [Pleurodeles waltl]|uniref:Uncharacterized protein n=1 Tax=Pleurodeles waltl TaxID=8319 RepID=A0AAV7UX73_PLEWA|nr:hypothetical protein NDU88_001598 [Pleurodeles waltl]